MGVYRKLLKTKNGDTIYPVVDYSALPHSFGSGQSYFQIGKLLIYFGGGSVTTTGKTDVSVTITFPIAYADTNYKVVTGCNAQGGYASVFIGAKERTVNSVKLNFWNQDSVSYSYEYNYLIIGEAG